MKFAVSPAPVALALVALVGLGACTSNPSAKAVAEDVVEALDLPADQRTCMLERLDGYTEGQLTDIGEANETVNFDSPDALDATTPAFQKFVEDLQSCANAG